MSGRPYLLLAFVAFVVTMMLTDAYNNGEAGGTKPTLSVEKQAVPSSGGSESTLSSAKVPAPRQSLTIPEGYRLESILPSDCYGAVRYQVRDSQNSKRHLLIRWNPSTGQWLPDGPEINE